MLVSRPIFTHPPLFTATVGTTTIDSVQYHLVQYASECAELFVYIQCFLFPAQHIFRSCWMCIYVRQWKVLLNLRSRLLRANRRGMNSLVVQHEGVKGSELYRQC